MMEQPEEFNRLLEIWLNEKSETLKNPQASK